MLPVVSNLGRGIGHHHHHHKSIRCRTILQRAGFSFSSSTAWISTASSGVVFPSCQSNNSRVKSSSHLIFQKQQKEQPGCVFFSSSTSNSPSSSNILSDDDEVENEELIIQGSKKIRISDKAVAAAASSPAAVPTVDSQYEHQRIWLPNSLEEPLFWEGDAEHQQDEEATPHEHHHHHRSLQNLLERIEREETGGGRVRRSHQQYGVLHENPVEDMRLLTENYTVPSLASALRDREDVLQYCAQLIKAGDYKALERQLEPFHPQFLMERRQQVRRLDVRKPLTSTSLETIRKTLMRMPRQVSQGYVKRAGVVLAICHVNGIPSILLEKRAAHLRAHPDEVCLPGGMVCSVNDRTIVETCLREMKEEIGGLDFHYHTLGNGNNGNGTGNASNPPPPAVNNGTGYGVSVLGVLRCNWGEVHHMVGVAVTPVVCFLGQDLAHVDLKPNPDEVAEVFTIPLKRLFDKSQWLYKDDHAPIFIGGPYVIWGLTGYILERFWKDVLLPPHVHTCHHSMDTPE